MKKGEVISKSNLRTIRPGLGLPPKYIDKFIGKSVKFDIEKGTPLSWDMI